MIIKNSNRYEKRVILAACSVALSVCFSFVCSRGVFVGGASAVVLNALNLSLCYLYSIKYPEKALTCLLCAAAVFGLVELLADALCVRCTGTLDYSVARSRMLLDSPWWMPLSWAVVAVQVGILGERATARFGLLRGALLTGLLGALLIPFYEEMAWGAQWWRYQNCLMLGHTPVYIIVAEFVIGAGLALLGHFALRASSLRHAALLGAATGLVTILGGMLGWGLVEFLGRGARPLWP